MQAIQTRRDEDIRVWVLYSLKDRQTFFYYLKKGKNRKKESTKLSEVIPEVQLVTWSKKWG